jgi:hypothetical protein
MTFVGPGSQALQKRTPKVLPLGVNSNFLYWKESFFGVLHGQSMDAVEFFTQKKVVVECWPKEWSPKF